VLVLVGLFLVPIYVTQTKCKKGIGEKKSRHQLSRGERRWWWEEEKNVGQWRRKEED
jgi:hypothetical protein